MRVERGPRLLVDHRADVGRERPDRRSSSSSMAPDQHRRSRGRRHPPARTARAAAEQRCPALSKAERTTSRDDLLGQRVESAIMAFCPPVSAMNGHDRRRGAQPARWLIARAVSVEPVKATPAMRGSRDERRADARRSPGRRCSTSRGTPASCSSRMASGSDERRLLGRLGDHGIAGGKRGGDLAGENREREIPRRDAGERPAPVQRQRVALAGRPRHLAARRIRRAPRRVVARVDRLAHFRNRVRD